MRMLMKSDESQKWEEAVKSELTSLKETRVWEIFDKPSKANLIYCNWVLKKNRTFDGDIFRYKSRRFICTNLNNAPFSHTYDKVVYFTIVRLFLAVSSKNKWLIHQVDYRDAFLQAYLDRDVYMFVPDMMLEGVPIGKMCLLLKNIYGMHEASRIWDEIFSKNLKSIGLILVPFTPCVFCEDGLMLICYVDKLLVIEENEKKLNSLEGNISKRISPNNMGLKTDCFLMQLVHNKGSVTLYKTM